jgi:hypothetical protein
MSSNDTPDTPTSPEAEPSGDDKRKARVIDGTAEDVTDKPGDDTAPAAAHGGSGSSSGRGMAVAASIGAFFVGAAVLTGVFWQAGLLNTTALTGGGLTGGTVSGPVASGDVAGRLDAADTRIAALLRDVERLGGELRSTQEARTALEGRLADVQAQLAAATGEDAEKLASADDLNAALRLITEIDGRLADAEAGVAVAETAVQPDQIEALQAVIAQLEERVAEAEATIVNAQAAERRVAAMEAGVAAIGAQQTTQATELGTVRSQIGALSARAEAVRDTIAATGTRLDAQAQADAEFEARLAKVEGRIDQPEAARRAALGIALASLAGAVSEGDAFEVELEAVAALAPDAEEVAALESHAARGVKDAARLQQDFQPVARAALRAQAAGEADGFWDRLAGNALSVVTVRQTGALEGDGLEARLARIDLALGKADVAAAVDEAEAIDGAAARELASWLDDARARAQADRLVAEMRAALLSDLAQTHAPGRASTNAPSTDDGEGQAQ